MDWGGHFTSQGLVDGTRVYTKDIYFIFQISMLFFFGNILHCSKKRKQLIQWIFFWKIDSKLPYFEENKSKFLIFRV